MTARVRLVIRGRVQGVWFRGAMEVEAQRLGVAGWVRNAVDGSVEAQAQGERRALDTLVVWAHHGPPSARVTAVSVEWLSPLADLPDGFAIRG